MINELQELDKALFLLLNGLHNPFWDRVMWWVSDKYIWIPLYVFFLVLVWKKYGKQFWIVLIGAALLITISDQVHLHFFKNIFERLRPCHDPSLEGMVHIVNGKCGGEFGFVSGHAANSFAIATFLSVLLGAKYRYFTPLVLLWASVVAYSRIYLGVHFPGDVICGALLGSVFGIGLGIIAFNIIRNRKVHNQ